MLWTELVVHVHVIITQSREKNHHSTWYTKLLQTLHFSIYIFYLFVHIVCTDFNLQVNKNVKECLQIVLENVDDNWNLVYEDGEMKVWAALNI